MTFDVIISIIDNPYKTTSTLFLPFFPSPPLKQSLNSHKSKLNSFCYHNSTEITAHAGNPQPHTSSTTSSPSSITPTTSTFITNLFPLFPSPLSENSQITLTGYTSPPIS